MESNTVTAISSYIPVAPEDLSVDKRVNRREARIGRIISYRIRIENISNGTIFKLVLEDLLPRGFSLVSGTVLRDGAKFDDPRGLRRLQWSLGLLPAGQSTTISYQAVIGSNVRRGQNINTATASGVDGGGNSAQGEDQAIVMIGGGHIEVPAEIEAYVFLDKDDNELPGGEDDPMEDIVVIVSSGDKQVTDKDGKTLFTPLLSGHYAVAVDERSLPDYIVVSDRNTKLVRLTEGERARVYLPVKQDIGPANLSGLLFYDENRNSIYEEGEPLPETGVVTLDHRMKTRARDGAYAYSGLTSGTYTLEAEASGQHVKKEINLSIGNNTINIPLRTGIVRLEIKEN